MSKPCCTIEILYDFETTHSPIPPQTNAIPIHVSRSISFPSAYHSPSTVNRKANELVIGTVSDSSASISFVPSSRAVRTRR